MSIISIRTALSEIAEAFRAKGMDNPKQQAEDLLCDLLSFSRSELHLKQHLLFPDEKKLLAQQWTQRRLKGEPLPYLSGHVQFYGCRLEITPAVLIPRPETEVLVDKIAEYLKHENLEGKILWDLCCGSGCIGIALKKKFPALHVSLSDCSSEALALAARNAIANGVEVACYFGDLLAPFSGQKAHYIVSNPPYISEDEYLKLDPEVRDYEPRLALVAGNSGLDFYRRLADELQSHLYSKGRVWLEIGYRQGEAVKELFKGPSWKNRRFENDWAGHHRFFFLENE